MEEAHGLLPAIDLVSAIQDFFGGPWDRDAMRARSQRDAKREKWAAILDAVASLSESERAEWISIIASKTQHLSNHNLDLLALQAKLGDVEAFAKLCASDELHYDWECATWVRIAGRKFWLDSKLLPEEKFIAYTEDTLRTWNPQKAHFRCYFKSQRGWHWIRDNIVLPSGEYERVKHANGRIIRRRDKPSPRAVREQCRQLLQERPDFLGSLNDMRPTTKEIFKRWVEGATLAELARDYGISTTAVRKRILRVRKRLFPSW